MLILLIFGNLRDVERPVDSKRVVCLVITALCVPITEDERFSACVSVLTGMFLEEKPFKLF